MSDRIRKAKELADKIMQDMINNAKDFGISEEKRKLILLSQEILAKCSNEMSRSTTTNGIKRTMMSYGGRPLFVNRKEIKEVSETRIHTHFLDRDFAPYIVKTKSIQRNWTN